MCPRHSPFLAGAVVVFYGLVVREMDYRSLCHLQTKVVEEALPVDDGLFLPRIHSSWDSHNAFIFSNIGSNTLHSVRRA